MHACMHAYTCVGFSSYRNGFQNIPFFDRLLFANPSAQLWLFKPLAFRKHYARPCLTCCKHRAKGLLFLLISVVKGACKTLIYQHFNLAHRGTMGRSQGTHPSTYVDRQCWCSRSCWLEAFPMVPLALLRRTGVKQKHMSSLLEVSVSR